jgi:hypothetical protein
MRALSVALALLGTAGCSNSSNLSVMLFADPGKYEYHTCDQILAAGRSQAANARRLQQLIDKAEQGAAGALVSTVAYRGEHRTAVEDLAVLDAVARRKNCLTPETWRSSTAIQ